MTTDAKPSQILLARLVVVIAAVFILLGAVWYGTSGDVRQRVWDNMMARPGGPMTFRFVLQPLMAAFAALTDGMKDARLGRSPYLWSVVWNGSERRELLREAVIATARIVLLGLVMDVIYQWIALKSFYPGEAVIVALVLCLLPYLLLRGPFARAALRWNRYRHPDGSPPS